MKQLASKEHLITLYLTYSVLLTKTQAEYFHAHYFLDYSLAEIAENSKISKNAVFLSIKQTERKLIDFEDKLSLVKKAEKQTTKLEKLAKKYNIPLSEIFEEEQ